MLVEPLYTTVRRTVSAGNCLPHPPPPVQAKECSMTFQQPLSPELEAKAQELLARMRKGAEDELLTLARLLVSKQDHEIFGETEFQARAIVHRIGAHAFESHLAQKKTATRAPASSAPNATNPPSSKATAKKRSSV